MSEPDIILHLLTARGRVQIPALRGIIAQLTTELNGGMSMDGLRTYKLCRALDMLGHCEHQRNRPGWLSVASPSFCRLPIVGKNKYLLTGARSIATIADLNAAADSAGIRVQITNTLSASDEKLLPSRITVEFQNDDCRRKFVQQLGIQCSSIPSGWALVNFSQGVEEFEANLEWHPRNVTLRDIQIFDPTRQVYIEPTEAPEDTFLCRRMSEPAQVFAVNREREARILDIDWGRHWAMAKAGVSVVLYDRRKRMIAAPAFLPFPRLLARALCLCSGEAPVSAIRKNGDDRYLLFSDIAPEISNVAARKLGTAFVPFNIDAFLQPPP